MNRFDRERVDGIRVGALAVYNAMRDRADVPAEIKQFALEVVRRAGDKGAEDSLEQLGVDMRPTAGPAGPGDARASSARSSRGSPPL